MSLHSDLSFTDSLKGASRRNFYERNKPIAVCMILIVFLLPILGVVIMGLSGAALGVAISVFAYYLTPYAVVKLRG